MAAPSVCGCSSDSDRFPEKKKNLPERERKKVDEVAQATLSERWALECAPQRCSSSSLPFTLSFDCFPSTLDLDSIRFSMRGCFFP
jgi:hypothetical protein